MNVSSTFLKRPNHIFDPACHSDCRGAVCFPHYFAALDMRYRIFGFPWRSIVKGQPMCGIDGSHSRIKTDTPFAIASRMVDVIVHHGLDDTGACVDKVAGAALAHGRLAILDLTPAGA